MNSTVSIRKTILTAIVSLASVGLSFAGSNTSFNGDRVTVASDKSFEQVTSAVKSLVAKNGMMVMAEVNQGKMLSMTGLSLKATLFVVGNPTVGKQLFQQDHGVGLYVPLRVFVYADASGKTFVSYDRPSAPTGAVPERKDRHGRPNVGPEAGRSGQYGGPLRFLY